MAAFNNTFCFQGKSCFSVSFRNFLFYAPAVNQGALSFTLICLYVCMSFCTSVPPSLHLYILLYVCTSFCTSVPPSLLLYVLLYICTSFFMSLHPSVRPPEHLYLLLYVCTSFFTSVPPSVRLYLLLYACTSFYTSVHPSVWCTSRNWLPFSNFSWPQLNVMKLIHNAYYYKAQIKLEFW